MFLSVLLDIMLIEDLVINVYLDAINQQLILTKMIISDNAFLSVLSGMPILLLKLVFIIARLDSI